MVPGRVGAALTTPGRASTARWAGDRGLVSFDRTMCRNLHRPTQPIHDVRRTTQRVPGAEHPNDQLRQPRQSPPLITTEPVRRRALFQGVGQPPQLGLILATPRSWRHRDTPGPFEARACSPPARHPYTAVCDTQAGGAISDTDTSSANHRPPATTPPHASPAPTRTHLHRVPHHPDLQRSPAKIMPTHRHTMDEPGHSKSAVRSHRVGQQSQRDGHASQTRFVSYPDFLPHPVYIGVHRRL